MTSENAAGWPAQGDETTSENTGRPLADPFGAAAPSGQRLPESPLGAAALDPFHVSTLIADTDPQRSDSLLCDDR